MKIGFLTLLVLAACGQQPLSQTQRCLKYWGGVSWRGDTQQLGCIRPDDRRSLPEKVIHTFKPTVRGVFAQQQSNGQHCLYSKRTPLGSVEQGTLSVAELSQVHGNSKVLSKLSVAADDVQTALRVQHAAMQLHWAKINSKTDAVKLVLLGSAFLLDRAGNIKNTCRDPAFLYRKLGDAFRSDSTLSQHEGKLRAVCGEQLAEHLLTTVSNKQEELNSVLQTAKQIFRGDTATFGYDYRTSMKLATFLGASPAILLAWSNAERGNYMQQTAQFRKITSVLPWIETDGASVCSQDIGI